MAGIEPGATGWQLILITIWATIHLIVTKKYSIYGLIFYETGLLLKIHDVGLILNYLVRAFLLKDTLWSTEYQEHTNVKSQNNEHLWNVSLADELAFEGNKNVFYMTMRCMHTYPSDSRYDWSVQKWESHFVMRGYVSTK